MKSKFYVLSLAFSFLLVTGCSSKETRSVNVTKQDTKIEATKVVVENKKANQDLFKSLKNYDINALKKSILEGADINSLNSSGNTLLLAIAQSNNIDYDYLEYVLSLNPDLYIENQSSISEGVVIRGRNAGMLTDDPKMITMLSEHGFDFNTVSSQGLIPLALAVDTKSSSTVKAILDSGANPNVRDKKGFSPLMLAIFKGDTNLIYLLINEKADVNYTDSKGNPPLLYAVTEEIISALIDSGANLYLETEDGKIVGDEILMISIENNFINIVTELINLNYNLNLVDSYGDTPLNLAVGKSNVAMVRLLIENGANPNIKDKKGFTAFDIAATKGNVLITNILEK